MATEPHTPSAKAPTTPSPKRKEPARRALSLQRRKSITLLFEEGVFAQIWITLTSGKFLTDMALFLGASAIHLGIINAIPFLVAPAQWLGAWLVAWLGSRMRIIIPTALVCRQIWWGVLLLILIPISPVHKLWAFIGIYAICHLAGAINGNAWISLIADLIPTSIRGRVVASRNGLLLLVGVSADFAISQLRESLGPEGRKLYLSVCILVATLAGLRTIFIFRRQWEPPCPKLRPPRFWRTLRRSFAHRGVRTLIISISMWNFAIGTAIAFWSPHMMNYLHLSFVQILIYTAIITALSFVMGNAVWGPVIDRAGALHVILACGAAISCIPFLYFFITPKHLLLYWVEACISGVFWSGFNAAIFNLPFQIIPEKNRSFYFAVLTGINGLALGVGSIAGGFLAEALKSFHFVLGGIHYYNYHATFLLSGVLRWGALLFLRRAPDSRSRGLIYTLQAVGDGVQKLMTSPRLILVIPRPAQRKKQPKPPRPAPKRA